MTVLFKAVQHKNTDMAQLLLDFAADPSIPNYVCQPCFRLSPALDNNPNFHHKNNHGHDHDHGNYYYYYSDTITCSIKKRPW